MNEDWMHEEIPDTLPRETISDYCDMGDYLINSAALGGSTSYLGLDIGPCELIGMIIDYHGAKIKEFRKELEEAPWDKWDDRNMMLAATESTYFTLIQELTNKDYDYIEEVADDISVFRDSLISGYFIARHNGADESRKVFVIGILMVKDLIRHLYETILLPID